MLGLTQLTRVRFVAMMLMVVLMALFWAPAPGATVRLYNAAGSYVDVDDGSGNYAAFLAAYPYRADTATSGTVKYSTGGTAVECRTVLWTADASGNVVYELELEGELSRFVLAADTWTTRTVTLLDAEGLDVLGAAGGSKTSDTAIEPTRTRAVSGTYTMKITGGGNGGIGRCLVYLVK